MLVGYVSDERHVALADVMIEFDRDGVCVAVVRSTPRGAVFSVGSITYPSSLLVDPHVSRVTANVLHRFLRR